MSDDKISPEPPQKPGAFPPPSPGAKVAPTLPGLPPTREQWPGPRQTIALIQGLYCLVIGCWFVLSPETLQRVTGPKTDIWLVTLVGALAGVIGIALWVSGVRRYATPESVVLAVGTALAFMGVEVYYAWQHVISKVYLADAVLQLVFIVFWLSAWKRTPRVVKTK